MAEIIDPRYILERITAAQREAAALLLHARGVLAENKTGHRDVVTPGIFLSSTRSTAP